MNNRKRKTTIGMATSRGGRAVLALLLVLVLLSPGTPTRAADAGEQAYREAKKHYHAFSAAPRKWRQRRNWTNLIDEFLTLHRADPAGGRADDALFLAARLYRSLYDYSGRPADLEAAVKLYEQLATDYAASNLADDALFRQGELLHRLGRDAAGRALWRRIIQDYPAGDMAGRARAQLVANFPDSPDTADTADSPDTADTADSPDTPQMAPATCSSGAKPAYSAGGVRRQGSLTGLARVDNIRYWSSPTYTRVVIDLDDDVTFRKGVLKDEHDRERMKSIYIDLDRAFISGTSRSIPIHDGILRLVKVAQYDKRTVRTVLHVDDVEDFKIFSLGNPPRVVVDVIGAAAAPPAADSGKNGSSPVAEPPAVTAVPPTLAQQLGLGIGTIVLDPGHGGKDPGAVGAAGLYEKEVVLDICRRVKALLELEMGCRVELTRDTDCFIPLEERTVIANTRKADLFVSIHANASRNRRARGIETYFLNLATDQEAMELAAKENATSTRRIGDLQLILNDLMRNSKINESSRLARAVQAHLVRVAGGSYNDVKDLGVKQAPFYVLIGAQMPSILVETSFISNQTEEKRLRLKSYRQKLAEGIVAGIRAYAEEMKTAGLRR
ncbi:MAG: N-acetylmuramoyl-L-alanine amidase [Deltaproteobacteria bacterium]|nr:N-acetylmuramoyl-L-alanine amidase [Candidatus Anaeroferrophillacea bacterium]